MFRVSVLIPTLNRLSYLRETLGSAQAQRGVELEILVSDDGSTDGTVEFVTEVTRSDPRVRLLRANPVPGIFQNVEYLIDHATGDAYTVLGDDDLLDEEFAQRLSEPLSDPAVVLSFADHRVIDGSGRVLPRATAADAARYGRAALDPGLVADPVRVALMGGLWLGFALYRRSAFPRDVFDFAMGTAADWDFALRAASKGKFYYVGGPYASYRDHGGTASRRRKRDASAAAMRVLASRKFADPDHERLRLELLADRAKRHAYQFAAEDRSAARNSLELHRRLAARDNLHTAVARLLLASPRPLAKAMQSTISAIAEVFRGLERRLAP